MSGLALGAQAHQRGRGREREAPGGHQRAGNSDGLGARSLGDHLGGGDRDTQAGVAAGPDRDGHPRQVARRSVVPPQQAIDGGHEVVVVTGALVERLGVVSARGVWGAEGDAGTTEDRPGRSALDAAGPGGGVAGLDGKGVAGHSGLYSLKDPDRTAPSRAISAHAAPPTAVQRQAVDCRSDSQTGSWTRLGPVDWRTTLGFRPLTKAAAAARALPWCGASTMSARRCGCDASSWAMAWSWMSPVSRSVRGGAEGSARTVMRATSDRSLSAGQSAPGGGERNSRVAFPRGTLNPAATVWT